MVISHADRPEQRPRVLVVENEAAAGIGRFGAWLDDAGLAVQIRRPYAGEAVPDSLAGSGLIVLGGPMGAHDDQQAPWLPATRALLRHAVETETPTLGICLGAQLLAVACGGAIDPGAAGPQVGVTSVVIDDRDDPLLAGIGTPAPFVQWHFDATTQLPASAVVLAHSTATRYEAFRIGSLAWGMSFHPEVEFENLQRWVTLTAEQLAAADIDPADVIDNVRQSWPDITANSRAVARNFATIMTSPER
jgi:GMP synthase (glutamine-hydrolysing)